LLTSLTQADREIAGCISDIGIHFSVENLQKPNQQQIQKVFEWFAELLMNTTRDTVARAMRAAAEDMCGGEAERLFGGDTRDLMGFFVVLRRLVGEVGRASHLIILPVVESAIFWRERKRRGARSRK